jgi:hypothetical protein
MIHGIFWNKFSSYNSLDLHDIDVFNSEGSVASGCEFIDCSNARVGSVVIESNKVRIS